MLTKSQKRRSYMRQELLGKNVARSTLFVSVYGKTESIHAFNRAGQPKRIWPHEAQAVSKAVVPWTITCLALMRSMHGKDEWKSMTLELSEPVRQDAIHKALSQKHFDWAKASINPKYLLTLAWVATVGPEPRPEVITAMLDQLRAWDGLEPVEELEDGMWRVNYA